MALALLGRRQGRLVARALAASQTWLGSLGAVGSGPDDELDTSPELCSTSQHAYPAFASTWPRSAHVRKYAVNNKPTIRYVPVPEPEHDDFKGEPTTYTQLLASIRSARSVKRLQHLVSNYTDRLDAVHVAAAVARLPHIYPKKRSGDPGKPPAGAAARLQDAARLTAELDNLLIQHAQHFFPRQAACSVWAFGELRRRGVVERMQSLPDILLCISKGDMEPMRTHGHGVDFAQLLQGLAKLGHNDPALMARLAPLVLERLGSMQQREIQMAVWGMAMLGHASKELLEHAADQLLRTGTAFLLPTGCAKVLWAFAKVGVQRQDLFNSLAGSMMGQALLLTPYDVCTALWACNRLGYRNLTLLGVLGDAMARSLAQCTDLEVSSAVESLASMGYNHAALLDAVTASILAEPVIGADPVCIVRVLNAFAKLGRRGPRDVDLVVKLARALVPRMPIVRAETLAAACGALDRYGYRDEGVLSAFALRAEAVLPGCSDTQLLPILRALANGGHMHFQLAVASARQLHSAILPSGSFRSLGSVVELLYLCARQGVEDSEAADALLAVVASRTGEIRSVDAARLMVIGQAMNKQTPLLNDMAARVMQEASSLDGTTAQAALYSAKLLGRGDVVAALMSAPQAVQFTAQGEQQGRAVVTGL